MGAGRIGLTRIIVVELTGVEPVSKQETNMLSTCLSGYCFSDDGRQSAAYHRISLCFFIVTTRRRHNYSRLTSASGSQTAGPGLRETSCPTPCAG